MEKIETFLLENSEKEYVKFNKKLIFSSHQILGVRLPVLKTFAKQILPQDVKICQSSSHEELLLFGFAGANLKTEDLQLECLQQVLPFLDNWATCDCITQAMKRLKGEKSYQFFCSLLESDKQFYVRTGIVGLMRFFLKTNKAEEIVQKLAKLPILLQKKPETETYYVKMAIAWLNAELALSNFSLAKSAIQNSSDKFIKNKSIAKARESFRLTQAQKDELLELKTN